VVPARRHPNDRQGTLRLPVTDNIVLRGTKSIVWRDRVSRRSNAAVPHLVRRAASRTARIG
jgi:hypothetical protein